MNQKLSLGERFFAPTPLKTLNVILVLMLIAVLSCIFYLITFENWAKYVFFSMLVVSVVLQFQVDWLAYALDEFEPFDDSIEDSTIDKNNEAVFFENLDLNTATIQQLYDAHYYWWDLVRNKPIDTYSDYEKARAKFADVRAKIDAQIRVVVTQGMPIDSAQSTPIDSAQGTPDNDYVYDTQTGLQLYKPKRDPKTGRFRKK